MSKLLKYPEFSPLPPTTDAANVVENIVNWKEKDRKDKLSMYCRPDNSEIGYRFVTNEDFTETIETEQKILGRNIKVKFTRYSETRDCSFCPLSFSTWKITAEINFNGLVHHYRNNNQLKKFLREEITPYHFYHNLCSCDSYRYDYTQEELESKNYRLVCYGCGRVVMGKEAEDILIECGITNKKQTMSNTYIIAENYGISEFRIMRITVSDTEPLDVIREAVIETFQSYGNDKIPNTTVCVFRVTDNQRAERITNAEETDRLSLFIEAKSSGKTVCFEEVNIQRAAWLHTQNKDVLNYSLRNGGGYCKKRTELIENKDFQKFLVDKCLPTK